MDHDQRFKYMLRVFFPDFMLLFFPDFAARLVLEAVEWMEQELFLDPPAGKKRVLDLVEKVPVKPSEGRGDRIVVLHLETDSNDTPNVLEPRLPEYFWHLRRKYQLT